MNAIIYIRVSTTEQAELGYSLKTQEETCLEYARRNNINVLRLFIEKGESAKTTNRTELKKLLDFIQTGYSDIDYLIVFKLDRLARNLLDYTNLISILSKYGILLRSATETIGESPEGQLMEHMIASFDQYDNDRRSQRVTLGMKQAVKEGMWIWKAPYGYKNSRVNDKPFLTFSKDSKNVEKVFNDFLNGKRQYEIAEDFKNNGIKMSFNKVAFILTNPIYAGIIKTSLLPEPVKGIHKPIIDETSFYKVQDILNKKPKEFYRVDRSNDFPLTRFLKCPYCNRNLKGSWSKGRSKKYPYYHCTKKGCSFKPIRKEIVEDIFTSYLKSIEPTNEVLDNFISSIKEFNSKSQMENKKRIRTLKIQLKELEYKKDRIEELAIDGTFTKDRFQNKISEVEPEIKSKKAEIENLQKDTIDIDSLLNYAQYFLKNLSKLWLNSKIEHKRKLQDYIFPNGAYIENNRCRTDKISTIFKTLSLSSKINSKMVEAAGIEPASENIAT